MNQLPKNPQNPSNKNTVAILGVVIGLGIVLLLALAAFMFRGSILQLFTPSTETPLIPTLFVPTPDCGTPTLVLGTTTFQIQNIEAAADGSVSVPSEPSGIAYWVEGTSTNYVFVISPIPENLAVLSTITVGSTAKATWQNCNSTTYSLSAPQQGSLTVSTLPDQSVDGLTVFFQTDASGAGFTFNGELIGEQISTFATPAADEVQAEIGLLDEITSPDGVTVRIGVSILNWGQSAFTLSASDVSLTQLNAAPLTPVTSEPPLPKEIAPGSTETIYFTFPRPSAPTATLKIFDIEYEITGY